MDDSDQPAVLPVPEARGEPPGGAPRRPSANPAAIVPPKRAVIDDGPAVPDPEPFRFEPTVFGAVRRYPGLVLATALLVTAGAVGYSLTQARVYQASTNVTVPLPVSSQVAQADPGQYLDNQVLIMQSQGVARRAAQIADQQLGGNRLDAAAFSPAAVARCRSARPPRSVRAATEPASWPCRSGDRAPR